MNDRSHDHIRWLLCVYFWILFVLVPKNGEVVCPEVISKGYKKIQKRLLWMSVPKTGVMKKEIKIIMWKHVLSQKMGFEFCDSVPPRCRSLVAFLLHKNKLLAMFLRFDLKTLVKILLQQPNPTFWKGLEWSDWFTLRKNSFFFILSEMVCFRCYVNTNPKSRRCCCSTAEI